MKNIAVLDIIDGNNWLNRAYYSAPKLTSSNGTPTGTLKLFINMVDALIGRRIDRYGECYLAVVFDVSTKSTLRAKAYAKFVREEYKNIDSLVKNKFIPERVAENLKLGYKGTRSVDPVKKEQLNQQLELAMKVLELRGITVLRLKTIEADDVVGTLTTVKATRHIKTVKKAVWSSDKDFAQFVTHNIHMMRGKRPDDGDARIKPSTCMDVFNVKPHQIIDFLALKGDKEDNIPGVPGIGDGKASALLTEFDNSTEIFRAAQNGKIPGALGKKLCDPHMKKLFDFSRSMVKIDTKIPGVSLDIFDYKLKSIDCYSSKLKRFASSLDMTKTFTR